MEISSWRGRSGILTARPVRSRFKSGVLRASTIALLVLGGQALRPSPAAADGTIFALIVLVNNSSARIFLPAGSASTGQLFGRPKFLDDFLVSREQFGDRRAVEHQY